MWLHTETTKTTTLYKYNILEKEMTEKLFLTTVGGQKSEQTPIWIMRQAGRYLAEYRAIRALEKDFITLCLNPKQACAVTMQPITRFGFDAAIIFSDILMVPWAMNLNVRFEPGIGPLLDPLDKPELINFKCLEGLTEKLAPISDALKLTRLSLLHVLHYRFCWCTLDINHLYC